MPVTPGRTRPRPRTSPTSSPPPPRAITRRRRSLDGWKTPASRRSARRRPGPSRRVDATWFVRGTVCHDRLGRADGCPRPPRPCRSSAHTRTPPGFQAQAAADDGVSRGCGCRPAVEVYGGPLLNSWLDREPAPRRTPGAGGRLAWCSPTPGRFCASPRLAIHLDRGVNNGLALDKQTETQPVWGLGDERGGHPRRARRIRRCVGRRHPRLRRRGRRDTARGAVFGKGQRVLRLRPPRRPRPRCMPVWSHSPRTNRRPVGRSPCSPPSITRSSARRRAQARAGPFLEDVLERLYAGLGCG